MSKVSKNWKMISQEKIIDNKYTNVTEEKVIGPNGNEMVWYVRRGGDFSIIIPIQGDDTYLVQQYRYPVAELSWEFPMGRNDDDAPIDGAKRELKEETGMNAESFTKIAEWWLGPGSFDTNISLFVAEKLSFGEAEPEENEFFEMKKFKISEVGDMIARGEILDGPTIAAYHYLENYLKK